MWVWLVGAFGLLLVWAGSYGLSFLGVTVPIWLRVLASIALVLFVAGVLLYRRWRAGAAARALERELMRQGEQQALQARPDRRAEIIELQRRMQQGIAALKKSRLGARGGAALYALPWYAIIGPPGAGKTTALRHSGLNFPFVDPTSGGGVRGSGGTRNCDWWFTNEAILLDTAGRYATEEDDREEWFAFLESLKKYRAEAPINGLIVAVSLPELMEADQQRAFDMAKRLRARVDEIMTRLDIVLPVYLMFTKADLVSGFVEFWGDLRKSERDQVFGATFPLESAASVDPAEAFGTEFDRLVSTLHARALRVIQSVRQQEQRQRVIQYPLEVKALRDNLAEFVGQLFQRNSFQENPVFRGFYITSGTQEGKPIDRVIGGMARAFGLRMPETPAPTDPKSYFVTNLFRRVMFPDQHLVARTATARRRAIFTSAAFITGGLLLTLLLLGPASCSFAKNRGLISDTRDVAAQARAVDWSERYRPYEHAAALDPARAQLQMLDDYRTSGAPFALRWGMYTGNTLFPALKDLYAAELEQGLAQPARRDLESALTTLGQMTVLPPSQYGQEYTRLKLYLMLTSVEHLDVDWAAPRLVDTWQRAIGSKDRRDKDAMFPHARYYLDLMKRGEIPPWKADEVLVLRSRTVLLRAPQLERMYETLVADANQAVAPIKRENIFYGAMAPFVTSKKEKQVDGAYTKEGWSRVRQLLGTRQSKLAAERWVLGEAAGTGTQDAEKQVERLRELYFKRYETAWREFLLDMEVRRPEDALLSLDELNALSEPEWPYQRMLRVLNENVRLDVAPEGESTIGTIVERVKDGIERKVEQKLDGGAAPAKPAQPQRPKSPMERAFSPMTRFAVPPDGTPAENAPPTGLAQYQAAIAKLVGVLTDLRDSQAKPDPSAVAKEFEEAFRTTSALLASQDGFTRPILSPYLMRPITGAWTGVVNDAGGAAGGLWEVNVWDKWRTALADKYPFVDAPQDVKLADYNEFFKPGTGLLWTFYEQNLKGSLDRNGNSFTPSRRFQSSIGYTPEFLNNCLSRGAEITQGTFPANAEEPAVRFDVNLHSVSEDVAEVSIEIDGVSHVYKNTPEEWLAARWPAKEAQAHGAKVRIRGYSGLDEIISRPGDFGFYRLLDAADEITPGTAGGRPNGTPTLVATWRLRSRQTFIKLDIRRQSSDSALSSKVFRGYKCPRVVAQAVREE